MGLKQLRYYDVIHCSTERQANILCDMMDKERLKWSNNVRYTESNRWNLHKQLTCYRPYTGTYCSSKFYKEERCFNIIEFEDFFKQTNCKFMKRCDE